MGKVYLLDYEEKEMDSEIRTSQGPGSLEVDLDHLS